MKVLAVLVVYICVAASVVYAGNFMGSSLMSVTLAFAFVALGAIIIGVRLLNAAADSSEK
jgi:hypothetical protein